MNGFLEVLYDDHEKALVELDQLEKQLDLVRKGELERAKIRIAAFARFLEDSLNLHFVQEEKALFPIMAAKIGPGGPVMVMEMEHNELREAQQALKAELLKESIDAERILQYGSSIIEVLRNHIAKENQVLFPMSEQILSADDWKKAEELAAQIALNKDNF
ncbi:hemerythrin domain-containing protein [Tepidibacillus sp. LV47]|uniref:hemerythrin domain-containing protein n=1 Tax=Tepidibacillus sp. LV47 TaxID=3398228 RepID=UPI003AABA5D7